MAHQLAFFSLKDRMYVAVCV